jgi:hypothetical protein
VQRSCPLKSMPSSQWWRRLSVIFSYLLILYR